MNTNRPILVTGATGYVDGRLAPALLQKGYRVRAMVRSIEKLACSPSSRIEVARSSRPAGCPRPICARP